MRRALIPTLAVALAVSACGTVIEGTAASPVADRGRVGGVEMTAESSGVRPAAPDPSITVRGTDGGRVDRIAAMAVSDVAEFWSQTALPKGVGEFDPLKGARSYDSTDPNDGARCGDSIVNFPNAFFCPMFREVSWDRSVFIPEFMRRFGEVSVALIMAHEIGHAVQWQIMQPKTTILNEQRADCFSGAYMAWAAEGNSPRFTLSRNDLQLMLRALVTLSDNPGTVHNGNDHGNGLERLTAWQTGWIGGVDACMTITDRTITAHRDGLPGAWDADEQRLEGNSEWTASLVHDVVAETVRVTGMDVAVVPRGCDTELVRWCESGILSYTLNGLKRISNPPEPGTRGDGTGLAVLIAVAVNPWVAEHHSGDPTSTGWCAVGVVARAMTRPSATVQLSAGDLGEMALGVLERESPKHHFAAIRALHRGVHAKGITDCAG